MSTPNQNQTPNEALLERINKAITATQNTLNILRDAKTAIEVLDADKTRLAGELESAALMSAKKDRDYATLLGDKGQVEKLLGDATGKVTDLEARIAAASGNLAGPVPAPAAAPQTTPPANACTCNKTPCECGGSQAS